ncbi:unnamed protein product [Trichobilharzia regenti]|nr:unnamed protein product [Trichobilharzia regenti]
MLEDKEELTKLLKRAAFQPFDFRLILFYQYLVDYGAKENSPFIDQDLIFHIEALRFEVSKRRFTLLPVLLLTLNLISSIDFFCISEILIPFAFPLEYRASS